MPRRIDIVIPADRSANVLDLLQRSEGVYTVRLSRGASVRPPGDLISAEVGSADLERLMRALDGMGIGRSEESVVITTQPMSVLTTPRDPVARDTSEATWEEMDSILAREGDMSSNGLWLMAAAGAIACVGLATNTLHTVVGAMVIAPGFEPLVRVSLGVASGGRAWRYGAADLLKGYAVLVGSALIATLLLRGLGLFPPSQDPYLDGSLIAYWSRISTAGALVALAAGVAGAILIEAARSVLTAGVMVALALIPGAALVGVGLGSGDGRLALQGALRWGVDAGLVLAAASAVFAWKRLRVHRRRTTHRSLARGEAAPSLAGAPRSAGPAAG